MINKLKEKFANNKLFYILLFIIIFIGIGLRVYVYFQQYALFLDESFVVWNLIEKSYYELIFHSAFANVTVPTGFLLIEKLFLDIFGNSELTFRFIPLLAGICSIFLFYRFAKNYLTEKSLLFATLLFCISSGLITFSNIVKMYSINVMETLLLLIISKPLFEKEKISIWKLSLLGCILNWFSFSIIFILASIGIIYSITYLIKKQKDNFIRIFIIGYIWILNLSIARVAVSSHVDFSVEAWRHQNLQPAFMPIPPDFEWFLSVLKNVTDTIFLSESYFLIVLLLLGAILLIFQKKRETILLFTPIIIVLIASAFELYPFHGRLILFLVPIFIIFIAKSLDYLDYAKSLMKNNIIKNLLIISIVLVTLFQIPFKQDSYLNTYTTFKIHDALKFLEKNSGNNDCIYVYYCANPTFYYYENLYNLTDNIFYGTSTSWHVNSEQRKEIFKNEIDSLKKNNERIWFFFHHIKRDQVDFIVSYLNQNAKLLKSKKIKGTEVYLYDFSKQEK